MKRFRFSLERILDLKKQETRRLMQEMAPQLMALNRVNQAQNLAKQHLGELVLPSKDDRLSSFFRLDSLGSLGSFQFGYSVQLREMVRSLAVEEKTRRDKMGIMQVRLTEAKKQEKALEIIKEKRRSRWKKKEAKIEERLLEEKATEFSR